MHTCPACGAEWPSPWAAAECAICLPYPCPTCTTRFGSSLAALACCT